MTQTHGESQPSNIKLSNKQYKIAILIPVFKKFENLKKCRIFNNQCNKFRKSTICF